MKALGEMQITIVGLGLMGGSFALAIRPFCRRIVGVDQHEAVCHSAAEQGIVDAAFTNLAAGLDRCDLLLLAIPVGGIITILQQLPQLLPDYGCAILDLGSTKGAICAAMDQLPERFAAVGGHPICGREKSGLDAAAADLYAGKRFVISPNRRTTPLLQKRVAELTTLLQMELLVVDPQLHDALLAATSHLPHLTASLLMRQTAVMQHPQLWEMSGTGLQSSVRLAGGDPQMMRDIILSNKEAILQQLVGYQQELEALISIIASGDELQLTQWLQASQKLHQQYQESTQLK